MNRMLDGIQEAFVALLAIAGVLALALVVIALVVALVMK